MKRLLVIAALILAGTFVTVAQDHYKVMDWKTGTSLRSYLLFQLHDQYAMRRTSFNKAVTDVDALLEYRDECRQKYFSLLGDIPEKTPLNPEITGTITADGYRIEKVIYESRPGHHVTSNLYLPDGKGPFPGILFFCGHEMISKSTESYQKTARLFVQNGFAVLVIDPVSQGERVQFTDSNGKPVLRGSTTEHTLLNEGSLLTGNSVVAWELFDNIRSLDYLVSRPEIDHDKIGCLGNSGGGVQTLYFAAFDDRVKVAAPCSFVTGREREYELNGAGDGCQQLPYEGLNQLELSDYLLIFAPKPLLILAGRYDFVDFRGTEDAASDLEKCYSLLGEPDKFRLFVFDDGHGISEPKRIEAVRWFKKWLCSDSVAVIPPESQTLDPEELWCTPEGQVNMLYRDEVNLQQVNVERVRNMTVEREQFIDKDKCLSAINRLFCLPEPGWPAGKINIEEVSSDRMPEYTMKKIIIRKKDEMPLPCIILTPDKKTDPDTLIIRLDHRGKSVALADSSMFRNLKESRKIILLADLRGMGETAENPGANDPKYYNSEYHNAVISLHIGKPLPGQRVRDILMLLDYVSNEESMKELPVKIIASGPAGPPAIVAAATDGRIYSLELSETINSFAEITEKPMEKDWFSYLIPGIIKYFDLPDVKKLRPDLKIVYVNR